MKLKSKVIKIPDAATEQAMETSLDTHLDDGWELVSVFNKVGATFAVLIKRFSR